MSHEESGSEDEYDREFARGSCEDEGQRKP